MKKLLVLSLIAVSGSALAVNAPVVEHKTPSPIPYDGEPVNPGGPSRSAYSGGPSEPTNLGEHDPVAGSNQRDPYVGKACTGKNAPGANGTAANPYECGNKANCKNNICVAINYGGSLERTGRPVVLGGHKPTRGQHAPSGCSANGICEG